MQSHKIFHFWADEGPVVTLGKMGCGRGKNVAAMEGGGNLVADHPGGVGNLARGFDAVAIGDRSDQPIVGEDKKLAFLRFHHHRFA
jgi:hypothetical protein